MKCLSSRQSFLQPWISKLNGMSNKSWVILLFSCYLSYQAHLVDSSLPNQFMRVSWNVVIKTNSILLLLLRSNLEEWTFRTCFGYRSAQTINSFHSLVVVAYMLLTCWGNNKAIIYQWSEIPQKFPQWLYIRILRILVYHPLDCFSNVEAAFETLKGMSFGSQKLCDLVYEIRSLPVVCMWHRFRV